MSGPGERAQHVLQVTYIQCVHASHSVDVIYDVGGFLPGVSTRVPVSSSFHKAASHQHQVY